MTNTELIIVAIGILLAGAVMAVMLSAVGAAYFASLRLFDRLPTHRLPWVHTAGFITYGILVCSTWNSWPWSLLRLAALGAVFGSVRVLVSRAQPVVRARKDVDR